MKYTDFIWDSSIGISGTIGNPFFMSIDERTVLNV